MPSAPARSAHTAHAALTGDVLAHFLATGCVDDSLRAIARALGITLPGRSWP